MNATLDSPLIEIPRDLAVSAPQKDAPQALRSTQPLHVACRIDCGSLALKHPSAEDLAQIKRLVQALLSGDNACIRLLAFTGTRDKGQSRMVGLRTAECLATQHGLRVCVIDAEVGTRDNSRSNWLIDGARTTHGRSNSLQVQQSGELWVLNASETDALLLPQSSGKSRKERLLDLHSAFDYIILCAPETHSSSSVSLPNDVEGIVLVVESGTVRRQALESAARTLAAGNARLLGTVLTGRILPIPERLFRWLRL